MQPKPAGYSGTPLARKLGMTEGSRVFAKNPPPDYVQLLEPLPPRVAFEKKVGKETDLVHLFCDRAASLKAELEHLRTAIKANGVVWVSWPKKASKVPTDMTEDVVRDVALPGGLVDNKVCAIDEVWSGLRLVWRLENR